MLLWNSNKQFKPSTDSYSSARAGLLKITLVPSCSNECSKVLCRNFSRCRPSICPCYRRDGRRFLPRHLSHCWVECFARNICSRCWRRKGDWLGKTHTCPEQFLEEFNSENLLFLVTFFETTLGKRTHCPVLWWRILFQLLPEAGRHPFQPGLCSSFRFHQVCNTECGFPRWLIQHRPPDRGSTCSYQGVSLLSHSPYPSARAKPSHCLEANILGNLPQKMIRQKGLQSICGPML